MLESLDAVVIGGGISGLTAAHALMRAGRSVALLEASSRFGGCIGSVRTGPYLADMGPQTMLRTPPVRDIIADLGLEPQCVPAPAGLKRYIYRRGRLVALPMSPAQFIMSPLVSLGSKLRVLREPFIGRTHANGDESVASFVRRHADGELLEALVAPLVSGVYAGDPELLSMRSAFPRIAELERPYGSVVRGALASARARVGARRATRHQSFGFSSGNQALIDTLVATLNSRTHTNARVTTLRQRGAGFMLECEGLPERKIEAARVVVATSANDAAELVSLLEPGAAEDLRGIEAPPIAQVVLAYAKDSIGVALDGFGFLAGRYESVRILGAVWNSVLLPNRCPQTETLVTAFLGGSTDPAIAQCSDDEVAAIAHRDLVQIMRIGAGRPHVVAGFRWSNGIPQYTLGHEQRIARIRAAIDRVPNLYLLGNFLSGVSVGDCIELAQRSAALVA